jgi:hypothetical protein
MMGRAATGKAINLAHRVGATTREAQDHAA